MLLRLSGRGHNQLHSSQSLKHHRWRDTLDVKNSVTITCKILLVHFRQQCVSFTQIYCLLKYVLITQMCCWQQYVSFTQICCSMKYASVTQIFCKVNMLHRHKCYMINICVNNTNFPNKIVCYWYFFLNEYMCKWHISWKSKCDKMCYLQKYFLALACKLCSCPSCGGSLSEIDGRLRFLQSSRLSLFTGYLWQFWGSLWKMCAIDTHYFEWHVSWKSKCDKMCYLQNYFLALARKLCSSPSCSGSLSRTAERLRFLQSLRLGLFTGYLWQFWGSLWKICVIDTHYFV